MTRERTIQLIVGALSAIALVAIIAITSGGEIDETTGRLLATVLTVAFYLLLGLAGNALARSGEAWSLVGAASVAICMGAAIFTVWLWWALDGDDSNEDTLAKVAGIFALFALVTSHGSFLLRRIGERSETGRAARYATFACGLLIATLLTVDIINEDDSVEPRILAALAILYALGTVVSPLLRLGEPESATD